MPTPGRRIAQATQDGPMTNAQASALVANLMTLRRDILRALTDPARDIDKACGYPTSITAQLYRQYYEREGIAQRVVNVLPSECWKLQPAIYEVEDEDTETEFEKAYKALEAAYNLLGYIKRADILSGIGHYGLLLLGLDDGLPLEEPAAGIDDDGQPSATVEPRKLIYLRTLDESLADIESYESEEENPRYGLPRYYNVRLSDPRTQPTSGTSQDLTTKKVHWSRVIHLADNRTTSEVIGTPRMKAVFNYLYNIKKIGGGNPEMFWKGGFPGYSFEANPDIPDAEIDKAALKAEFAEWGAGLDRILALTGGSLKSQAPQVVDPTPSLDSQLNLICITIGVPLRVFMGSEQAKLASSEDKSSWNDRLKERNSSYTGPCVVRPTIDRLQAVGILPRTAEPPTINWPDLNTQSNEEKAKIQLTRTQALAAYVGGGVNTLVPEKEYLTKYDQLTGDEADAVLEAAEERIAELDEREDERALAAGEVAVTVADQMAQVGGGNDAEGNPPPTKAAGDRRKQAPKGKAAAAAKAAKRPKPEPKA